MGTASPKAQIVVPRMLFAIRKRESISSIFPLPCTIRSTNLNVHPLPSRHGEHWPQDSCAKNRSATYSAFTMHVVSSMTMTPADPASDPALASESKSLGTSHSDAVRMGVDIPPGI